MLLTLSSVAAFDVQFTSLQVRRQCRDGRSRAWEGLKQFRRNIDREATRKVKECASVAATRDQARGGECSEARAASLRQARVRSMTDLWRKAGTTLASCNASCGEHLLLAAPVGS